MDDETARDYFIGQLAGGSLASSEADVKTPDTWSEYIVSLADALMKARKTEE